MTYDKLVFMFDFENVGDGSDQSTFYFDDIEQVDASGGLSQIDLPCTFEDETVDQTTYDFWGNASQDCGRSHHAGQPCGGGGQDAGRGGMVRHHDRHHRRLCQPHSFHRGGEDDQRARVDPGCGNPDFAQDGDWPEKASTAETIQYTTQEGWETLEFNFGNELPGGPELEVNYPYDLLVIFFGFGDEGVEGGTTYYFDDVYFGEAPVVNSVEAQNASNVTLYPNPAGQHECVARSGSGCWCCRPLWLTRWAAKYGQASWPPMATASASAQEATWCAFKLQRV